MTQKQSCQTYCSKGLPRVMTVIEAILSYYSITLFLTHNQPLAWHNNYTLLAHSWLTQPTGLHNWNTILVWDREGQRKGSHHHTTQRGIGQSRAKFFVEVATNRCHLLWEIGQRVVNSRKQWNKNYIGMEERLQKYWRKKCSFLK